MHWAELCETPVDRQTLGQRAWVLIAGPGAGFILLGLTLLIGYAAWGISPRNSLAYIKVGSFDPFNLLPVIERLERHELIFEAYRKLLWINFWWGVFNLFPIWPLDGGQLAQVFLTMGNRRHGRRWGHVVSLVTAGLLAIWEFQRGDQYTAFFLAYFAFINFQALQSLHETEKYGVYQDDADWWRR